MSEKVRPQLDEDVVEEVTEVVNQETRIPADRLSFGERVEVLLDMYHEAEAELDEYDDAVGQYKQKIQALRGQLQEADTEDTGGLLG